MSGSLAPSKSTVYISNLPYSLTNSDLHQLLTPYGKVVRVTILKSKDSRKSKGVAFALFVDRNEAHVCAASLDNSQLFDRTIKASIARDNGRAAEFIRRREYPNKSRCYECGEFGHLSYKCPRNALGDREPPPKKKKVRKPKVNFVPPSDTNPDSSEDSDGEDIRLDSWSAAINYQTQLNSNEPSTAAIAGQKKRIRRDAYFSDEEEEEYVD